MNHDGPMNEVGLNVIADVLSMLGLPGGALASLGRVVVAEHGRRISVTLATAEAMTGLSREELAADHLGFGGDSPHCPCAAGRGELRQ